MIRLGLDRVRRALVPVLGFKRLLRREDLDEPFAESVEPVGVVYVTVQGSRIELGQDIDFAQPGVDAVGNRDVHKAELSSEGHRGLRPPSRQRIETLTPPAAQDDRNDLVHESL